MRLAEKILIILIIKTHTHFLGTLDARGWFDTRLTNADNVTLTAQNTFQAHRRSQIPVQLQLWVNFRPLVIDTHSATLLLCSKPHATLPVTRVRPVAPARVVVPTFFDVVVVIVGDVVA